MFKKIMSWLDINFEPMMMALLFYAITLLVSLQVVLRFVFSSGFSWGEELARFMFVWLMYFSIAYATRNQRHIRVSFLINIFSEKIQKGFMILTDLIFLCFATLIFISAVKVCQSIFKFQDMAVTLNVSLNIVYGAGAIGLALIIIRLIQTIVYKIRKFKAPIEEFINYTGKYTKADQVFFFPKNMMGKKSDTKKAVK